MVLRLAVTVAVPVALSILCVFLGPLRDLLGAAALVACLGVLVVGVFPARAALARLRAVFLDELQAGYVTFTFVQGLFWRNGGDDADVIGWDWRGLWTLTSDGRVDVRARPLLRPAGPLPVAAPTRPARALDGERVGRRLLRRPGTPVRPGRGRAAVCALLAVLSVAGCDSAVPAADAPPPTNGSFRFLDDQGGRPLTWSRCREITWKLNAGGAQDDVVRAVRDAVARMAQASGFVLDDQGSTDAVAGSSTDVPGTLGVDVLVEIVPDDATDLLTGSEWARTDVRPVDGRIGQAIVAISATRPGGCAGRRRTAVLESPRDARVRPRPRARGVRGPRRPDVPDARRGQRPAQR